MARGLSARPTSCTTRIAQHLDVPGLRLDGDLAFVDGEHGDIQSVNEMSRRAARHRAERLRL